MPSGFLYICRYDRNNNSVTPSGVDVSEDYIGFVFQSVIYNPFGPFGVYAGIKHSTGGVHHCLYFIVSLELFIIMKMFRKIYV